jgi:serine/threonine-protein kinase RsbW
VVTAETTGSSGQSDDRQTLIDEVVTLRNMTELHNHVLRLAAQAGLPTERAQGFAVAVNEAVINAIQHAGGSGKLAMVQDDQRRLIAEVRDAGPGMPCSITFTLPPPQATGGRGMWLAGKLADHMEVQSNQLGTTIRLEMDLPSP